MINVRKAEIKDINDIVNIKLNGWKLAYKDILDAEYLNSMDYDKNYKQYRDEIENNSSRENYVIEEYGHILGFAKIAILNSDQYDSQMFSLYIRADIKNKGYGTILLEHIKNNLKNRGCKNMILWCIDKNEQAKQFYRKKGGVEQEKIMSKIGDEDICEVSFLFEL